MAETSLERFLTRERGDLFGELESRREQALRLDVFDQALLGGWCEFAAGVRRAFADEGGESSPLLAFYADRADDYEPTDEGSDRDPIAAYVGATVNGAWSDLRGGAATDGSTMWRGSAPEACARVTGG